MHLVETITYVAAFQVWTRFFMGRGLFIKLFKGFFEKYPYSVK